MLEEAESLLKAGKRKVPEARLAHWEGLVKWFQGEKIAALELLEQGAAEHPKDSGYTVVYLTLWWQADRGQPPYSETTGKYLALFPEDAAINALHATALYRDDRFGDAYEALQAAEGIDKQLVQYVIGPQVAKAIIDARWMTPPVLEGISRYKSRAFTSATEKFREVVRSDPDNVLAARMLGRSLVSGLTSPDRVVVTQSDWDEAIEECTELCTRFPEEAELQLARSALLRRSGNVLEADNALENAKLLDPGLVEFDEGPLEDIPIRDQRRFGDKDRWFSRALFGGFVAAVSWLGVMFGLGTLLAVFTSRIPQANYVLEDMRTPGDIWLERFYLLVLGLSLVFFYLSVPFVALGLLAITLALFGLFLIIRIIHFGILYRGFFATWEVIRSAFIGLDSDVLGIRVQPEEHPELFRTIEEVAERLNTDPVQEVYLTPDASIGVQQSGRGPFGLFRRTKVMSIGLSTLSQLNLSEFKSILAHEFGHFTHQDPFYTRFISQVTGSLAHSLAAMSAAAGVMNYVNPFYWFYWLYLTAYGMLASGFSRSREFLADRRSVLAYGKSTFVSALKKAGVNGELVALFTTNQIQAALVEGQQFVNVFDAYRQFQQDEDADEVRERLEQRLANQKPSWFDSHPTFKERVAALEQFPDTQEPYDSRSASELIVNVEEVEEKLTKLASDYMHHVYEMQREMEEYE